jgi:hypothetical protein
VGDRSGSPLGPAAARRAATIVHAALTGAIFLYNGLFLFATRGRGDAPEEVTAAPIAIGVLAAASLAMIGTSLLLRRGIQPPTSPSDPGPWWVVNLPKMIIIWGSAEACALAALAIAYVFNLRFAALLPAALAIVILFLTRPAALAGE